MKISYPYMGTSHIAFSQIINDLGHEAVTPPVPSKKTLGLGTRYAPEFACLPFKILLGSYLEAIEKGAEMIITSGGVGPCRAGYYGILHQKILNSLGYKVPILVFEPPLRNLPDFVGKIKRVIKAGGVGWRHFVRAYRRAWHKLKSLDATEYLSHTIRPYEITRGATTTALRAGLRLIDKAYTEDEVTKAARQAEELLCQVPQDHTRKPIKIGIIGEIYVVLEPFANLDLEVTLEEMGVYTHRSIYLTDWTRDNSMVNREKEIHAAAKPYLNELIGGHGINSVGNTVLYHRQGFDGVIQLAPFTCIPEIVAKGILSKVSTDLSMPVMTFFLDEQTGKAGAQTRLEAFVDLLKQRRERKGSFSNEIIPGY